MSEHHDSQDGLGADDVYHRRAYIWFVGAVLFSFALTLVLSSIDRYMYDSGARYLDETKYRENRRAATSIASEGSDPRQDSTLRALTATKPPVTE